ncbi:unnamed protein product [Chrysodeixis includens]|uniref:Uncharacterized protein n=1 Tax=Chrysodeixis includens TaxID=689277 RepID=A0A9N8KX13_CHRIL|nr:unnamed protein product [Chrysodeixis includens]
MLFINFLCLLYLMVLIDSHTISKHIDNDEKADDIFDSITDLDHTRSSKRRDRFLHKYQQDDKDEFVVKTVEAIRLTKAYSDSDKTTETTSSHGISTTSTEHTKRHKSPKKRVGSFWRKLRGKDKKDKNNERKSRRRRRPNVKDFEWTRFTSRYVRESPRRNKGRRKNTSQFGLWKSGKSLAKRELPGSTMLFKSRDAKKLYTTNIQIGIAPHNIDMASTKGYKLKTATTSENIDKLLQSVTTQVSRMKQIYGVERFTPSTQSSQPIMQPNYQQHNYQPYFTNQTSYPFPEKSMDKSNDKTFDNNFDKNYDNTFDKTFDTKQMTLTTTPMPKYETEFVGTAQIEELLNDIKLKAIQSVAEQNPYVTDLITNKVTDATIEADPILTHIDYSSPGYYLSTFVSINDIKNALGKRTVPARVNEFALNDSVLIANTEPHYIVARSLKEDTYTMARNVEDMLQRKLKNVLHRVTSDFRSEIHKVKSTLNKMMHKVTTKLVPKHTTRAKSMTHAKHTSAQSSTSRTTAPRHLRGERPHQHKRPSYQRRMQHTRPRTHVATHPTPTYDDFMMLTLYEQMLAKTQEQNVRKLLTTNDRKKKRREHFRLSKRNPETLSDIKLREYLQNVYEEVVNMPDYDYMDPSIASAPPSSNTYEGNMPGELSPFPTSLPHTSLDDTSYEGLSNKISYNDFVNGYKHYLKFQKEQGSQNFSNLVKYQAHRHHNVDDIGKFILNKIPQLPNRRKRFFDETDIDYQETSTKTDDNWFKKHFYLFVDNGPPKKFHTSQTVPLKSAFRDQSLRLFVSTEDPMPSPGPRDHVFIKIGSDDSGLETTDSPKNTANMNLDELSKILNSIKDKQATGYYYRGAYAKETELTPVFNVTDSYKILPQGFIDKIFGNKRRRTPKILPRHEYDYTPSMDMLTDYLGNRLKRDTTEENEDDDEDEVEDKYVSTTPKENYGSLALLRTTKENTKVGFVDIDLVPQTLVLNLKDNSSKHSRFKNFFNKFHFKKKNPKHIKERKHMLKRQCYTRRKTRFNPIRKLKEMFKIGTDDEKQMMPNYRGSNVDYEITTSDMLYTELLKPVKFDRPLSVEEMKQQVPNISDIIPYETTIRTTTHKHYSYKLDESDRKLLSQYHVPNPSTKPAVSHVLKKPPTVTTTASPTTPKLVTLPGSTTASLAESNVMTVNVKTINTGTVTTITPKAKFDTSPMITLDDMNLVLNNIQQKLAKSSRNFPKHTTINLKRGTLRDMILGRHHHHPPPPPHKRPVEELMIKSKLTRIAKFPISKRHFKNKRDETIIKQALDNDYSSLHEAPSSKELDMKNRNPNAQRMNAAQPPVTAMKKSSSAKFKHTDYYNDLLMWHNDILNLDQVPAPIWKSILKNIQGDTGDTYTTPNMNHLVRELNEINEFLDYEPHGARRYNNNNIMPNASIKGHKKEALYSFANFRSKPKKDVKPNLVRSVAMDDKTLVTSNNILIKGEAKFFQYNNKPQREVKTKNILDKLNIHRKNVDFGPERDKGTKEDDVPNEPAILVDTTMLAYDDDANSVTNGVEVKKLSRNSQESTKARKMFRNHTRHTPRLKTNQPPVQYYTTPLPMSSNDFNKFLKDHKMDVESVTAPMFEVPTFVGAWAQKPFTRPSGKQPSIKGQGTTPENKKKEPPNYHNNMKALKPDALKLVMSATPTLIDVDNMKLTALNYKHIAPVVTTRVVLPNRSLRHDIFEDFDRYKRFSELYKYNPYNLITGRSVRTTPNYYKLLKSKIKLFDKKSPLPPPQRRLTTDSFTIDPRNKEVEITIINFDDIDKMTTNCQAYELFTVAPLMKKDDGLSSYAKTETANEYKTSESSDSVNNELLYKDIFKDSCTTTTTTEFTPADFLKNTDYSMPTASLVPGSTKIRNPFEYINKLPAGKMNMPKRVQISSHHYKYDIFYNDDRKNKGKVSRPKLSPMGAKLPIKITPKHFPSTIFRKAVTNTDIRKKIFRQRNKTRNVRDVSTVNDTTTPLGSLVYDLKHLRRSTTAVPVRERRRQRFKISTMIQDKLKSLMKNATVNKMQEPIKHAPCLRSACNCTASLQGGLQPNFTLLPEKGCNSSCPEPAPCPAPAPSCPEPPPCPAPPPPCPPPPKPCLQACTCPQPCCPEPPPCPPPCPAPPPPCPPPPPPCPPPCPKPCLQACTCPQPCCPEPPPCPPPCPAPPPPCPPPPPPCPPPCPKPCLQACTCPEPCCPEPPPCPPPCPAPPPPCPPPPPPCPPPCPKPCLQACTCPQPCEPPPCPPPCPPPPRPALLPRHPARRPARNLVCKLVLVHNRAVPSPHHARRHARAPHRVPRRAPRRAPHRAPRRAVPLPNHAVQRNRTVWKNLSTTDSRFQWDSVNARRARKIVLSPRVISPRPQRPWDFNHRKRKVKVPRQVLSGASINKTSRHLYQRR